MATYITTTDLFSAIDDSKVFGELVQVVVNRTILANDGVNGFDVESSTSLVYVDSTNLHYIAITHQLMQAQIY